MNQYEISYLLNPDIKEEEILNYVQKIKDFITEFGGEISKDNPAQKRKLAYLLKKARFGYFGYILFNLEPQNVKLFDKKLKLEDSILRYLIISVDKNYLAQMQRQEEEIKEKFQKIMQQPTGEAPKKAVKSEEKEKIEEEIEKKLEEILG